MASPKVPRKITIERVHDRLIETARQGGVISYSALYGDRYQARSRASRELGEIALAQHRQGNPLLSAIAVLKLTGRPANGLWELAVEHDSGDGPCQCGVPLRMPGETPDEFVDRQQELIWATWRSARRQDGSDAATFNGPVAIPGSTIFRGEQGAIRARLLGGKIVATCALCGVEYPVRFLVAAHIKPRHACSDPERRDIRNVAMVACALGCDLLFETGAVVVTEQGVIARGRNAHPLVGKRIADLLGRRCKAYRETTASYFAWHRDFHGGAAP